LVLQRSCFSYWLLTAENIASENISEAIQFRSLDLRRPIQTPIWLWLLFGCAFVLACWLTWVIRGALVTQVTNPKGESQTWDIQSNQDLNNRMQLLRGKIAESIIDFPSKLSDKNRRYYLAGVIDTLADVGQITEEERGTLYAEFAF
jgi:hypothetical protein